MKELTKEQIAELEEMKKAKEKIVKSNKIVKK